PRSRSTCTRWGVSRPWSSADRAASSRFCTWEKGLCIGELKRRRTASVSSYRRRQRKTVEFSTLLASEGDKLRNDLQETVESRGFSPSERCRRVDLPATSASVSPLKQAGQSFDATNRAEALRPP